METRDSEIKIPGKGDIPALDEAAVEKCQSRWLSIAKPLFGLGTLEDAVTQIAGITGTADVSIDKKGLIVMCADNGVVEEGISQTDSSVTAVVTDNFFQRAYLRLYYGPDSRGGCVSHRHWRVSGHEGVHR